MSDLNRLYAPPPRGGKLTVEIDNSSHSVYIRFKTAKVHKTLSDSRDSRLLAIDVDSRGEIIGIELVGIQDFSISQIRRRLPERFKKMDFEQARWVQRHHVTLSQLLIDALFISQIKVDALRTCGKHGPASSLALRHVVAN